MVLMDRLKGLMPESVSSRLMSMIKGSNSEADQEIRLSCDLGNTKIALLEVIKNGSDTTITRFLKIARPEQGGDPLPLIKKALSEAGFQSTKVRVAVKGQGIIIRFVQFPFMTEEELRGAISFEAEKYIPFKSDDVIVDYHVLDREVQTDQGKMMNVLLVAAKKDEIYKLIQMYQDAGFQVEMIDVDSLAFMNAVEYLHPEEAAKTFGIIDFGNEISTLGICRSGKPLFIRDISFGNQDLAKRIKRKSGGTFEEFRQQLGSKAPSPELEASFHELIMPFVSEIRISLDYYKDQNPTAELPQTIFLSGFLGAHPSMEAMISKEFGGIQIKKMKVLEKVKLADGVQEKDLIDNEWVLPVSFGLCIRNL